MSIIRQFVVCVLFICRYWITGLSYWDMGMQLFWAVTWYQNIGCVQERCWVVLTHLWFVITSKSFANKETVGRESMKCIQTVATHTFSFLHATYAHSPAERDKLNWIVLFSPDPLFEDGNRWIPTKSPDLTETVFNMSVKKVSNRCVKSQKPHKASIILITDVDS